MHDVYYHTSVRCLECIQKLCMAIKAHDRFEDAVHAKEPVESLIAHSDLYNECRMLCRKSYTDFFKLLKSKSEEEPTGLLRNMLNQLEKWNVETVKGVKAVEVLKKMDRRIQEVRVPLLSNEDIAKIRQIASLPFN